MKIVCLIKSSPPLIYFVNQIQERYGVELVVIEKKRYGPRDILERAKKLGALAFFGAIKDIVKTDKRKIYDYERYFSGKWEKIHESIPILETEDINSKYVFEHLKEIQPDLLLDHGTSIVHGHLLKTSKLALNLHWGLSPYYRGTHCTEWALINWDPYNIGVTIHRLSDQIDGGDIVAQARAEIKCNDTLHSINMQLTYLGTELILELIDKLKKGEKLKFFKQDLSLGYITYLRQWNHLLCRDIKYIEKKGLLETMLEYPSRKEKLGIVTLRDQENV